ncbi:hypothetical protein ACSMC0_14590 [Escherichia coli]|uniref:hypothetical protein n=1 Tax=Escherichia coli TaxID=562 RepID=UPI00201FA2AF|nr:hypothetical protein [Escherichia coli]
MANNGLVTLLHAPDHCAILPVTLHSVVKLALFARHVLNRCANLYGGFLHRTKRTTEAAGNGTPDGDCGVQLLIGHNNLSLKELIK